MRETIIQLLLADDDIDDCDLFKEALEELQLSTELNIVHNGEHLMQLLADNAGALPKVLFLDLNMPKKNGFECLAEIKQDDGLKDLPVIIFSTSFDRDIVNLLYDKGAHYYISKPNEFDKLKSVIHKALSAVTKDGHEKNGRENFVLQP
ncbi:MAG: rcp1 2 [Sediminibacterium sp.]|nr:rcp1 2 [Sediminibacterium sp.]